jgi:hypothetical protein
MNVYTPDCWQILKIQAPDLVPGHDLYYRVLAGWGGSYLYGASWKLSSGIESFVDEGDYYSSDQSSGSVYKLNKTAERMSGLMAGIVETYKNQANEQNWILEVITLEDFLKEYNGKTKSI